MFVAQVVAALALAPVVTGEGDANAAAIAALWAASIPWSVVAALCVVRQADLPDIATASMLVTIAPYAAFTLMAAYEARGTRAETNLVDAMFLGVTGGAAARLLRLPTTRDL